MIANAASQKKKKGGYVEKAYSSDKKKTNSPICKLDSCVENS